MKELRVKRPDNNFFYLNNLYKTGARNRPTLKTPVNGPGEMLNADWMKIKKIEKDAEKMFRLGHFVGHNLQPKFNYEIIF